MTTIINDVQEGHGEPSTFEMSVDSLAGNIRLLMDRAEELERLGSAIVDAATPDPEDHGNPNPATVLLSTSLIDDMAEYLARIQATRKAQR